MSAIVTKKGGDRISKVRRPELLAPAGTVEAFRAALEHGADAVYVGLKAFNARALARNFSLEEVAALCDLAHERGRRLFVAFNALVREEELGEIVETLAALEAIGVDALITQDLGVWRLAREHFPGLRLHASTLMTIHNSLGVQQAHRMGFSRVVLAREMTLAEIAAAVQAAPIEVEVFVHGAMCFSFSGLCLFSSFFGGKASTRGRCVQPCRRRYDWRGKSGTFFSMDDLSALDLIPRLREAGVHSLKIEGRLRPAHYVASVVRAYRTVLDAEPGDEAALREARKLVQGALGRRLTSGYFESPHPAEAVSPTRSANTGQFLGTIVRQVKGEILLQAKEVPSSGDRLRLVDRRERAQVAFKCQGVRPGARSGLWWIKADVSGVEAREARLFRADVSSSPLLASVPGKETLPLGRKPREALQKGRRHGHQVASRMGLLHAPSPSQPTGTPRPELWLRVPDLAAMRRLRAPYVQAYLLEINERNVHAVQGKARRPSREGRIIWALPLILPEDSIAGFRRLLHGLVEAGYREFQVAGLGHLPLFQTAKTGAKGGRLRLVGAYTLNLLNSQAVAAAVDLGVDIPQFSIETDEVNALQAAARLGGMGLAFTVFGHPPLFTSRMDHPDYDRKAPVVSPKGERFYWRPAGGVGYLLDERPFSLLGSAKGLWQAGFRYWILDVSRWPTGRGPISRLPRDLPGLIRGLRGVTFNWRSRLE